MYHADVMFYGVLTREGNRLADTCEFEDGALGMEALYCGFNLDNSVLIDAVAANEITDIMHQGADRANHLSGLLLLLQLALYVSLLPRR